GSGHHHERARPSSSTASAGITLPASTNMRATRATASSTTTTTTSQSVAPHGCEDSPAHGCGRPFTPVAGRLSVGAVAEVGGETRARLLAERADARARLEHLTRDFESIVAATQGEPPDDEHDPDGATVGFERAQVQALAAATREQLAAID